MPTERLQMRRYHCGNFVHVSWCQLFESLRLTGRLKLIGPRHEQLAPPLQAGSVKLGPELAERWTQRTAREGTALVLEAQKMQRVIETELVHSGQSALAGTRSPNCQAMAGTSV